MKHVISPTKTIKTPARPSGCGAIWVKYGKEVSVKDYVQAGREGTEIKSVMEQKGGLMNLKGFGAKSDTSDTVIDMSILNPVQAGKVIKVAGIIRDKQKAKAEAEAKAKAEAEAKAKAEAEAKLKGGNQ